MSRIRNALLAAVAVTAFAVTGSGCGEKAEPDPSAPAPPITYEKSGGFAGVDQIVRISPMNRLTVELNGKQADASAVPAALVIRARTAVSDIDFATLEVPPKQPSPDELQIAIRYDGRRISGGESELLPLQPIAPAVSALDAIIAQAQPVANGKDGSGGGGSKSGSGSGSGSGSKSGSG